jgi:hypothetical protein
MLLSGKLGGPPPGFAYIVVINKTQQVGGRPQNTRCKKLAETAQAAGQRDGPLLQSVQFFRAERKNAKQQRAGYPLAH